MFSGRCVPQTSAILGVSVRPGVKVVLPETMVGASTIVGAMVIFGSRSWRTELIAFSAELAILAIELAAASRSRDVAVDAARAGVTAASRARNEDRGTR